MTFTQGISARLRLPLLAVLMTVGILLLATAAMVVPNSTSAAEPAAIVAAQASEPGAVVTFAALSTPTSQPALPDSRIVRLVALYVPKMSAPSPFTSPGPFTATFEGDINLRLRAFLVFSAIGKGKLALSIGGKPVLDLSGEFAGKVSERVRLGKGKNHFIAVYQSPSDDDAALRLFWSSNTFQPEPIPPMVLTHDPAAPGLANSLRTRNGRSLVGEFRCTKCHAPTLPALPAAKTAMMPELAMDAPSFDDVGARLSAQWLAAWIDNPRALRTHSHMPRLFESGNDREADTRPADAAAFLASLDGSKPLPSDEDPSPAKAGGRIFAQLNCVACHTLPDAASPAASADDQRVPLRFVKAKFRPGALREYLLNPQAHYAWNPMPNFRLSNAEASAITAYLLSFDGGTLPVSAAGDKKRGRDIVLKAGCLACHNLSGEKSQMPQAAPLSAMPNRAWITGCMARGAVARKSAPNFMLSEEQADAMNAFALAGAAASLDQDAPAEFAERQIRTLRCTACHARDGSPSLLASTLEDELNALQSKFPPANDGEAFAPDQRAPMLTWAGEKLRPQWMAEFIAGNTAYKPRPYLRARMPSFAARALILAQGLASEHGCAPDLPPEPKPDLVLAEIGRTLCGKAPNQGLGCVQCHAAGSQPPLAPFEAPAPNFNHVTARLRMDYYFRWVHDPLRVDPEAKMPRFDDDDGKTGIAAVLDGDARRQFDAIWNYCLQGQLLQPPAQ